MKCIVRSLASLYQSSRPSHDEDDTRLERAHELVEKIWGRWGEGRRERWRRAIGSSIQHSSSNSSNADDGEVLGGGGDDGSGDERRKGRKSVMVTPLKLWLVRAEVEELGGATVWNAKIGEMKEKREAYIKEKRRKKKELRGRVSEGVDGEGGFEDVDEKRRRRKRFGGFRGGSGNEEKGGSSVGEEEVVDEDY